MGRREKAQLIFARKEQLSGVKVRVFISGGIKTRQFIL
jgi:hypothetical protein